MKSHSNTWQKLPPDESAGEVLRLHKRFPDDPDVLIIISKVQNKFEVESSAESRTSGPSVSKIGSFQTLEEAATAAEASCAEWDEGIESSNPPDWSSFRVVDTPGNQD